MEKKLIVRFSINWKVVKQASLISVFYKSIPNTYSFTKLASLFLLQHWSFQRGGTAPERCGAPAWTCLYTKTWSISPCLLTFLEASLWSSSLTDHIKDSLPFLVSGLKSRQTVSNVLWILKRFYKCAGKWSETRIPKFLGFSMLWELVYETAEAFSLQRI